MKKYYFVNFTIFTQENKKFNHMSVILTEKSFFPILEVKKKIKKYFDKDIGLETNILINSFQEVSEESFYEFHEDLVQDFAIL